MAYCLISSAIMFVHGVNNHIDKRPFLSFMSIMSSIKRGGGLYIAAQFLIFCIDRLRHEMNCHVNSIYRDVLSVR